MTIVHASNHRFHERNAQRPHERKDDFVWSGLSARELDRPGCYSPGEIARDDGGYVLTGRDILQHPDVRWNASREPFPLETSMPGVFAAGDVRHGSIARVAAAVGDGATVVRLVHEYLREFDAIRPQKEST